MGLHCQGAASMAGEVGQASVYSRPATNSVRGRRDSATSRESDAPRPRNRDLITYRMHCPGGRVLLCCLTVSGDCDWLAAAAGPQLGARLCRSWGRVR
jgi:hypothetical protein